MNVLETMIKVGAIWTGAHAVAQAAQGAQKVEKSWLLANLSIKRVAESLAAFGLGFKGVQAFSDFLKEGVQNARELRDAHEQLELVMANNRKFQAAAAKQHMDAAQAAHKQAQALTNLAEEMSKTGLKTKTLETAWTGAIKAGLSPDTINKNAIALQNLVVKMGGIKAGTDEAAHAMQAFRGAIQGGRGITELAKIGVISYENAKAIKKMGSEQERATAILKALNDMGDLAGKQFATTAGQVERAHRNWELLGETLGGPLLKSQDAFAIAMGKIAVALQPVAEELAPKMTIALDQLATALSNSGPQIVQFGQWLATAFQFVVEHWSEISKGLIAIGGALVIVKTAIAGFSIIYHVIDGLHKFQTIVTSLPALLGFLSNPITLTIGAIVLLAAAIYAVITHWDWFKKTAVDAWHTVQTVWGNAVSWFQGIFNQVKESTKGIWEPMLGPLSKLWAEIQPLIQPVIDGVVESFKLLPAELAEIWKEIVDGVKIVGQIIQIVAPYAQQAFQNWLATVSWVISNIVAPIINAFADIIHKIRVGDLWGAFLVWVNVVKQIELNIVNAIVQLFGRLPEQIRTAIAGVYDAIFGVFKAAYDAVIGLFAGIGSAISGEIQKGVAAARNIPLLGNLIPKQHGGLVTSPTAALLGEAGPEMVIPMMGGARSRGLLTQAASMIGAGGMTRNIQGGEVNVNFSAPITITGVAPGQERAMATEVQRALQDPIRTLLDQLKKVKSEEARLSYA